VPRKPKHPTDLPAIIREISGFVYQDAPDVVIEVMATQLQNLRRARQILDVEGLTLIDDRGRQVEHPCVAIELAAIKQISELSRIWAVQDVGAT